MQSLANFVDAPYCPLNNFNLASEYDALNQYAAAISFYLRSAEKTNNLNLQYISLIKIGLCFHKQGDRNETTKNILERAISVLPNRPEGYLILSLVYEKAGNHSSSYMVSNVGLTTFDSNISRLPFIDDYFDKYKLIFQKSIAAWNLGSLDEARVITHDLLTNYFTEMTDEYKSAVQTNFNNIGYPKNNFIYTNSLINEIKYEFNNIKKIHSNYSQSYQDMFVLLMLNGKPYGTYLEIGSGDPFHYNNTALLEKEFDWIGISIELDQDLVNEFNSKRKNTALCKNALDVDYELLLKNYGFDNIIDYLQIDCNPSQVSFNALQKVLNSGFKFRVITFEHDYYVDPSIKQLSRDLLLSYGYTLLVNDVSFNYYSSFEDWWVLKDHVNLVEFPNLNSNNNLIRNLFFK